MHNIIQVYLPFIQSWINMESATTIYKNGNELHTQPTSVQFHTLQMLRAWVLDVPPLRVQSNKLGATWTEVYVCGS